MHSNFGNVDPYPEMSYVTKGEASNKYDASSPLFQHPKWYDVLSRGGRIASFVLEGQCTAAKGVGPLLSLIFWVRGTGTCLLGRGFGHRVCFPAGSSQLPARPVAEEEKLPRGRGAWGWVNTFTLHLEDTLGPPSWVTKEDLTGNMAV